MALAVTTGRIVPVQATSTTTTSASHTETVHTTANHPWLTSDRGWVEAGDLQPGEPVVTLSGATETVAWVHGVAGQADMYNLTVAHDHTYAVGDGHAVVHNDDACLSPLNEDQIQQGLTQAENARGTSAAGTVAKISGDDAILGSGASGKLTTGPFAPGIDGPYNVRWYGRCAEFYCSLNVGQTDTPLDLFVSQVNGKGPCRGCASTLQRWANANGNPIRVFWRTANGGYKWWTWLPTP